jgi:hypothetical protein
VGCTAHCAALATKDFCKFLKTTGRYTSSWGVEWLDATNRDTNTAANYLNDSGSAKAIVHQHQHEIYGGKKAIAVSVPNRFGTNQFVMEGLDRCWIGHKCVGGAARARRRRLCQGQHWGDLGCASSKRKI